MEAGEQMNYHEEKRYVRKADVLILHGKSTRFLSMHYAAYCVHACKRENRVCSECPIDLEIRKLSASRVWAAKTEEGGK